MDKPELIIDRFNIKGWYLNGEHHREDGPALIFPSGSRKWLQHNRLHREDGPAIIWADGTQEWWIMNHPYTFDGWCADLNKTEQEITFLRLKYGST